MLYDLAFTIFKSEWTGNKEKNHEKITLKMIDAK